MIELKVGDQVNIQEDDWTIIEELADGYLIAVKLSEDDDVLEVQDVCYVSKEKMKEFV